MWSQEELAVMGNRFEAAGRRLTAMEHTSPEARKKYLDEHPDADKSKHTVKEKEEGGKGKGEDGAPKEFSLKEKKDYQEGMQTLLKRIKEEGHDEKGGKFDALSADDFDDLKAEIDDPKGSKRYIEMTLRDWKKTLDYRVESGKTAAYRPGIEGRRAQLVEVAKQYKLALER